MKKRNKKSKRIYRKWHSWLGLMLVLPLLFFTITGLLLNHTEDLELDKKRVKSEWVMRKYGLSFEGQPSCYRLASGRITAQWEGQLLLDGLTITPDESLIGACELDKGICLATSERIHYISPRGEVIETLDSLALPEGSLLSVGVTEDKLLVVKTTNGDWGFDTDLVESKAIDTGSTKVIWSEPSEATDVEKQKLKQAIIGSGMPLDRVILDIHSGNLFQTVGKVLVDIFGFGILLVSFTGIILFFRNKKRRNSKEKSK